MRPVLTSLLLLITLLASAQYYYKDIVGTRETADLMKAYERNHVTRVLLTAYDAQDTKSDDFLVEQDFTGGTRTLTTITRSNVNDKSQLTSYLDEQGNVIRTVDSNSTVISTTAYQYNASGQLMATTSTAVDTGNTSVSREEHLWQYAANKPLRMLRIKDGADTAMIDFSLDANGNVSQEQETHKGIKSEPVYYYYDSRNRLTDIVRFNKRAKRLLPEYMFEYSPTDQVIQKITVPANNSNYLIWRYQYDDKGLKTKEYIYNKQKQLTGKVEYQYSFS